MLYFHNEQVVTQMKDFIVSSFYYDIIMIQLFYTHKVSLVIIRAQTCSEDAVCIEWINQREGMNL